MCFGFLSDVVLSVVLNFLFVVVMIGEWKVVVICRCLLVIFFFVSCFFVDLMVFVGLDSMICCGELWLVMMIFGLRDLSNFLIFLSGCDSVIIVFGIEVVLCISLLCVWVI